MTTKTTTTAPTLPSVTDIVGPVPDCPRQRNKLATARYHDHLAAISAQLAALTEQDAAARDEMHTALLADEPLDAMIRRVGQIDERRRELLAVETALSAVGSRLSTEQYAAVDDPIYRAWAQRRSTIANEYRAIEADLAAQTDLDPDDLMAALEQRITRLAARHAN